LNNLSQQRFGGRQSLNKFLAITTNSAQQIVHPMAKAFWLNAESLNISANSFVADEVRFIECIECLNQVGGNSCNTASRKIYIAVLCRLFSIVKRKLSIPHEIVNNTIFQRLWVASNLRFQTLDHSIRIVQNFTQNYLSTINVAVKAIWRLLVIIRLRFSTIAIINDSCDKVN